MATGGGHGDVTLIANYSGKRLSLTVPTNAKVGDVIQKAVETLNLKREDLPLSLFYQGNPIDDMTPLDVSRTVNTSLVCCPRTKHKQAYSGRQHKSLRHIYMRVFVYLL